MANADVYVSVCEVLEEGALAQSRVQSEALMLASLTSGAVPGVQFGPGVEKMLS